MNKTNHFFKEVNGRLYYVTFTQINKNYNDGNNNQANQDYDWLLGELNLQKLGWQQH